jgi:hypothetical protein
MSDDEVVYLPRNHLKGPYWVKARPGEPACFDVFASDKATTLGTLRPPAPTLADQPASPPEVVWRTSSVEPGVLLDVWTALIEQRREDHERGCNRVVLDGAVYRYVIHPTVRQPKARHAIVDRVDVMPPVRVGEIDWVGDDVGYSPYNGDADRQVLEALAPILVRE